MKTPQLTPSFESFADASSFFVDVKDENGDDQKRKVNLRKACVVVTIPFASGHTEKVAFMKTNRGENYRDSRGKKVTKQTPDGPTSIIRPLMIPEREVKEELLRLLDDAQMAHDAFRALQV